MPLLKKRSFEKKVLQDFLRDDEEVFHCEITNEIFRDYEEFSERMLLCNSMVWTCSMTGKSNLTYAEALDSEISAKRSLKEFPVELRMPILFLASKTKRTSFGDMADDVFCYAKDRYFVGENLEASFTGNKWKESHVLHALAPSQEQTNSVKENGSAERSFSPPAHLFKYEIEHLDADDKDISEIMIVDHNQIRRKKAQFNREKCKLFLKQYVEQDSLGILTIKPKVIEEFGLNNIKFEQIFDGPLPNFEASKRAINKVLNGAKKTKQEQIGKYLTKNGQTNGLKEKKSNLLEQMKQSEAEFKKAKQQREEEKVAMKLKKKEDALKLQNYLREWSKPKEDLELEDQQKLPELPLLETQIPKEFLGDVFMIMEFVENFSELLFTTNFFPLGLSLDVMERALLQVEVAGPLTDLVQMLINALFNAQEEESRLYRTELVKIDVTVNNSQNDSLGLRAATRLATKASRWSYKQQGMPLNKLPLYSMTVSEILRLHLLASGARINDTGAKWRYAQRGGYTSEDDPGIDLRLRETHILEALSTKNIVELALKDKIKIIVCLINQLLTYADTRDLIEDKLEKVKSLKFQLRTLQAGDRKRELEFYAARAKLRKETGSNKDGSIDRLTQEFEEKNFESDLRCQELYKELCGHQTYLGQDRAFRRYLKLDSIPGIYVCHEGNTGSCLEGPIKQEPDLQNADRKDLLVYVRKVFEEMNSSDKENEHKVNGSSTPQASCSELLVCSADPSNCPVHLQQDQTQWFYLRDELELDELISSLNKRGFRESELQQTLQCEKNFLLKYLGAKGEQNKNVKVKKEYYENANMGYSADLSVDEIFTQVLTENILEMEEKIFAGALGSLKVNREEWRHCLLNKQYDKLDKTIHRPEVVPKNDSSDEPSQERHEEYWDPGRFLLPEQGPSVQEPTRQVISTLAVALLQVALSIGPQVIKKPLGHADLKKNDKKAVCDCLHFWEQSLMASTSFSQIFVHYGTLDACIMWSKSLMQARCRCCRRKKDSEKMLLCDSCNSGYHLYCLKPILTVVPKGDWFCPKCQKEKADKEKLLSPSPKKKRRIFRVHEEEESDPEPEQMDFLQEEEVQNEMDLDYEPEDIKVDVCKTCGSGGEMIGCEKCSYHYHIECVSPPLRRPPRGPWTCPSCKDSKDGVMEQCAPGVYNQRRCAEKARHKIHDFVKSLRHQSHSDHDQQDDDSDEEVIQSRRSRRDEVRDDLPLHNAALQELLADVMKHQDAWAFVRPVQKYEVPDYYDVISKPMDFGTIKYKLNMGEYKLDEHLMQDAILVFENCNTYNHSKAEVYKCGVRLLKHFQRKCKELGLNVPEELIDEQDLQPLQPRDEEEHEVSLSGRIKRKRTKYSL